MALVVAACVGSEPDGASPVGSGSSGGASSGQTGSSSSSGGSSSSGASGDACSGATCSNADTLRACDGAEVACALGCSADPERGAICNGFDPTGPASPADLEPHPGELAIDLPVSLRTIVFDTQTGSIVLTPDGEPELVIRPGNADPDVGEQLSGIWFERRAGVGLFRAHSWTLRNGWILGDLPAAFVASTTIDVLGHTIAACGQVGGASFSDEVHPGNGRSGAGAPSAGASGGGGGGHHTAGRSGGDALASGGGALAAGPGGAAVAYDPAQLRGGGRGGHGGAYVAGASPLTAQGGGGGGVVLLAAGARIRIGDGTPIPVVVPGYIARDLPKGINVGGCGGHGGLFDEDDPARGGGGGGAGGLLVLEAPVLELHPNAGLAANGGGGGGSGHSGGLAQLAAVPTSGGPASTEVCGIGAEGGRGAGGGEAAGAGRGRSGNGCGSPAANYAGGGGGGAGRVRLANRTGALPELPASTILSPTAGATVTSLQPR